MNHNINFEFCNLFSRVDYEQCEEIRQFLSNRINISPKIGIICGSGLGGLAELISDPVTIDYKDIPHFPVSTVAGHKGALVFGDLAGAPVMCMKGRIHPYEGYSLTLCTLPVRVMKLMGVQTMIVTNAAGGLNNAFNVADIMSINDHIFFPGFSGNNPLRGPNDERFGARFPPMNKCYDKKLMQIVQKSAEKLGITQYLRKGVYAMLGGPNYETVAEAKFLQNMGIDAVGMSTVHEVIVATHSGIKVMGFSLITNKVVTDYEKDEEANHAEVLEAAAQRAKDFEQLIQECIRCIMAQ